MLLTVRLFKFLDLALRLLFLQIAGTQVAAKTSKQLIFTKFKDLGGVYIKFLQILALNADFLHGWAGPAEFEVFDNLQTDKLDINQLLRKELGPDYNLKFKYVEYEPSASGSFAQVYKAQLTDGTVVALKALRPSLIKTLNFDLKMLGLITTFIKWTTPSSMVNIKLLFRDFAQITREETDYLQEMANTKWFYDYFKKETQIVIPKIYKELSSALVITQDYIGGLSLSDVLTANQRGDDVVAMVKQKTGSDLWQQLEMLGENLFKTTFLSDYMPGDPHPGNVKLLAGNKVGLIDFGIVAGTPLNKSSYLEVMKEYRNLYDDKFNPANFFVNLLKFFDTKLASALITVGHNLFEQQSDFIKNFGLAAARRFDYKLATTNAADDYRHKKIMRIFNTAINDGNVFGLHLNLESAATIKSANTYMMIIYMLSKNHENFGIMQRVLTKGIAEAERVGFRSVEKPAAMPMERALETVSDWLANIADRDPFLYRQLTDNISIYGHVQRPTVAN